MNRKSIEDRAKILQLLVEGNSIRGTARVVDCSMNTVMKLLVDTGTRCISYLDESMRSLPCKRVQVDEMQSFVGCRRKQEGKTINDHPGEIWLWTALCADTKLIPAFTVGDRSADTAQAFIADLALRFTNRIQLTSDGYRPYENAVEGAFGDDVDYAMLVKRYSEDKRSLYQGAHKQRMIGAPDMDHASTSYIERSNLTLRMGCRRFARRTNAHSKKLENHSAALGLHFMHYNFCRLHQTLRVTPAMAAGITNTIWSIEDMALKVGV